MEPPYERSKATKRTQLSARVFRTQPVRSAENDETNPVLYPYVQVVLATQPRVTKRTQSRYSDGHNASAESATFNGCKLEPGRSRPSDSTASRRITREDADRMIARGAILV